MITRDRAIEILREDANYASLWELAEAVDMAIEALKEERQHGEWVQQPTMEGHTWYECSVCKSWIQDMSCYDYCPNCGARMTGEGEAK